MEDGLKAKSGKVVCITTKKEETIIQEVLKKDFRGSVVQSDSDDITTTKPKIVAQVLSYLGTTLMDTATAPEIASERGVDFNKIPEHIDFITNLIIDKIAKITHCP
jgi:hypothetical protein